MLVSDARRLTGPNLLLPGPGAVVEWTYEAPDDRMALTAAWHHLLDVTLPRVGLADAIRIDRDHPLGASRALGGVPIDRLYALANLLEWAAKFVAGDRTQSIDHSVKRYLEAAAKEHHPALLALQAAASAHGVPFLWDDEAISVGYGAGAKVYPTGRGDDVDDTTTQEGVALPAPEAVPWASLGTVPVALVTGTNGKTTTARMLSSILRAAGHDVGTTGTDGIARNGALVEAGDWTGPGAARKVLRRPDISAAVLETARGGMLRRGLGVDAADVAVVTNIGEDHFGEYGILSLDAMAEVKALVWSVAKRRVYNADDRVLTARVPADHSDWIAFGLSPESVAAHRQGGEAWFFDGIDLVHAHGALEAKVVRAAELPTTFGGSARHNIANALAAAAMAAVLGVDDQTIARALTHFGAHPKDNAGRAERYDVQGLRLLLDFSHNPHGVRAIADPIAALLAAVPGSRLAIAVGQAGDRSDHDMRELCRAIVALDPTRIHLRELFGYERGRAPGETAAVLRAAFEEFGMTDIVNVASEVEALDQALAWGHPGDLIVHLVHIERDEVQAWIADHTPT